MTRRSLVLALAAGASALLVVGVTVTEALNRVIWPSLLVGIPAGIAAGVAVAAFVYRGLAPGNAYHRPALALAGFGVAFLAVLVVAALGLRVTNTEALLFAGVVGAAVAGGVYVRTPAAR